jgi:hypothetical protein
MWKHGSYRRYLQDIGSFIKVPMWICSHCRKTASSRPLELLSYFQSTSELIIKTLRYRFIAKRWYLSTSRQRAGHWLNRFLRSFKSQINSCDELDYLANHIGESESFLK